MITFEITHDRQQISRIVTHPCIWDNVTDDSSSPKELYHPSVGLYVLVKEKEEVLGLFFFQDFNGACVQIHTAFLPCAWGKRALQAGKLIFPWFFEHFGGQKVIGFIPDYNQKVLSLAMRSGMHIEGKLIQSYQKNGQLYDQIIVAIDRR